MVTDGVMLVFALPSGRFAPYRPSLDRFLGFAMLPYYGLRWCVAPKGKQHIKKEEKPRMVSYYQVLGVSEGSSQDEIKQAYRERMKAHHPDLHGQSNDPIARLIAEAYS